MRHIPSKKGVTKMSQGKSISKHTELVRNRKEISFRPVKSLYRQVARISKKRKVSMNQLVNEFVEKGIQEEGVNNASLKI